EGGSPRRSEGLPGLSPGKVAVRRPIPEAPENGGGMTALPQRGNAADLHGATGHLNFFGGFRLANEIRLKLVVAQLREQRGSFVLGSAAGHAVPRPVEGTRGILRMSRRPHMVANVASLRSLTGRPGAALVYLPCIEFSGCRRRRANRLPLYRGCQN